MMPWWPIVFSFVGALIVAVGMAFTVQGWPRYVIVSGSTLTALGGLWFAIEQVSYQTGGESFGYLRPYSIIPVRPEGDMVEAMLMHQGGHPLYELRVTVVDLEKLHEHNAQTPRGLWDPSQYQSSYPQSRLDPQTIIPGFVRWYLPEDRDEQGYNIWIASERNLNRGVFEQLRFRRIDNEWRIALRVVRDNQVLIEQGRQYLPRDEKGQAIWEKGIARWAR
jgi:hypothetical protein